MPWFGALPHARLYGQLVAVTLGFAIITYFHVVVGELVPKSLALRRADALAIAVQLLPCSYSWPLCGRIVRLLRGSAAAVLRGFDIPMTEHALQFIRP